MYQDPFCLNINIKKTQKGYTLVEIMVSILFFAVIALSLSHTFSSSILLASTDNNLVKANNTTRLFIRDIHTQWLTQTNFDAGNFPEEGSNIICKETIISGNKYEKTCSILNTSSYIGDKTFTADIVSEDLESDDNGNTSLRRVYLNYYDSAGKRLMGLFYDFSRPESNVSN